MIALHEKSKCTGCTACAAACPVHCISMERDNEGFLYPAIDQNHCIQCGKCSRICPVERQEDATLPLYALGMNIKDENIRKRSSSGGVFYCLASHVLKQGGVVFGAAYDGHALTVTHKYAAVQEDLGKMMGSKYVQSSLNNTFSLVIEQLETGKQVLFSGTPCQISGLRAFLAKDYENLINVSVICHGVPSPLLWDKYIEKRSTEMGEILSCDFRNKQRGWNHFGMKLISATGKTKYLLAQKDPYMRMFLSNLSLRPSCYRCGAKNNICKADIVIGDFWGVEHRLPELADDKGTSLVLVYSQKGDALINLISGQTVYSKVDSEKALLGNRAFSTSVNEPGLRSSLFADIERMNFDMLAGKYVPIRPKERVKLLLDSVGLLGLICRILGK